MRCEICDMRYEMCSVDSYGMMESWRLKDLRIEEFKNETMVQ
ncbi:MAG: hypothetical protein QME52_05280 [Bacteroidota bacterium]|nr:hypothetical protein [Bacteroidota bacterium]